MKRSVLLAFLALAAQDNPLALQSGVLAQDCQVFPTQIGGDFSPETCFLQKFEMPTVSRHDRMGWSCAIGRDPRPVTGNPNGRGNTLLAIGSPFVGRVELYGQFPLAGGGSEYRLLKVFTGSEKEWFGHSIAITATGNVFIGAPLADVRGLEDAGTVYEFEFDYSILAYPSSPSDQLFALDMHAGDQFGYSLSVAQHQITDGLAVGAIYGDGVIADQGVAYRFQPAAPGYPETFVQTAKVWHSNFPQAGDRFGHAVSIDKDINDRPVIAVGAPRYDVLQRGGRIVDAGAAYAVTFETNGTWGIQNLPNRSPQHDGRFGASVDVEWTVKPLFPVPVAGLIVGAPKESHCGKRSGAATIYDDLSGTGNLNWSFSGQLYGDHQNAQFGKSVGIEPDHYCGLLSPNDRYLVVVGARLDDSVAAPGKRSGACEIFRRTGVAWFSEAKFVAFDTDAEDRLGHVMAVDYGQVLVGAPTRVERRVPGSAYMFRFLGFDEGR